MTLRSIHYRTVDGFGEVVQVNGSVNNLELEGCARVEVDFVAPVECGKHCFDPATGLLHEMTAEQLDAAQMPEEWEIRGMRNSELAASDVRVGATYHNKPVDAAERAAWLAYRQKLRDLPASGDVAKMAKDFPARPDGIDAGKRLRERAEKAQSAKLILRQRPAAVRR